MDNFERENKYIEAQNRLKKLKGFYHHLFWYLLVNIVILVIIYINSRGKYDMWNFGVFSTAFFWGIGLFFHALSVFGKNLIFSRKWEQRKIKEFMDEDKF